MSQENQVAVETGVHPINAPVKKRKGREVGAATVPFRVLFAYTLGMVAKGERSPDAIAEAAVKKVGNGRNGKPANLTGSHLIKRLFGTPLSETQLSQVRQITAAASAKNAKLAKMVELVDIKYVDEKGEQTGKTLNAEKFGLTVPVRSLDMSEIEDLFADLADENDGDDTEAGS